MVCFYNTYSQTQMRKNHHKSKFSLDQAFIHFPTSESINTPFHSSIMYQNTATFGYFWVLISRCKSGFGRSECHQTLSFDQQLLSDTLSRFFLDHEKSMKFIDFGRVIARLFSRISIDGVFQPKNEFFVYGVPNTKILLSAQCIIPNCLFKTFICEVLTSSTKTSFQTIINCSRLSVRKCNNNGIIRCAFKIGPEKLICIWCLN